MKLTPKTEALVSFVILFALNFYLGTIAPWWAPLAPALLAGWLLKTTALRVAPLAALAAWLIQALYRDFPTGFRLSNRIAGVMGTNTSVLAYVATGLIIAICVALSAFAGKSLRAALFARTPQKT